MLDLDQASRVLNKQTEPDFSDDKMLKLSHKPTGSGFEAHGVTNFANMFIGEGNIFGD